MRQQPGDRHPGGVPVTAAGETPAVRETASFPGRVKGKVRAWTAGFATTLTEPQAVLLTGKTVRFRAAQTLLWSVIAGLFFVQVVYGLYDAVLQVAWWPGHSLKAAWDTNGFGLVHSGNWPLYRHLSFRDTAGPALATMGIVTVTAKRKYWDVPVSTLRMVTAPLVIIVLTFALGTLGVYLVFFGLPDAWHHLLGSRTVPGTRWLGYLSAGQILIGVVTAKILHRYWAPVGAALQGSFLDWQVDRWQAKAVRAGMSAGQAAARGMIPAVERLPLAPPAARERLAQMWRDNTGLRRRRTRKLAAAGAVTLLVLLALLGAVGHYAAGHGIAVPYLFPKG